MIFSARKSVVIILAVLWTVADANSKETLVLRIFNSDHPTPDNQLMGVLKKADLESHGYTKEFTTSLVSESGSGKPVYRKQYLYYKIAECSRVREIVQELQTLMPDAYTVQLASKLNSEVKARNLESMRQCKVGLEVHFKDGSGCPNDKTGRGKRRALRAPCGICIGRCGRIDAFS